MKMLRSRLLRLGEGTLWALGLTGLVGAGVRSRLALASTRATLCSSSLQPGFGAPTAGTPDQSLWSPERIAAWRTTALDEPASAPLAVLRIPKIRLE